MSKSKKLFLLFSHTLTTTQIADAKSTFAIDEFVTLSDELQKLWSNVPSDIDDVSDYLKPLKAYLKEKSSSEDVVLVQGDFGATYHMVNFVKSLGMKAIHATTKRDVIEKVIDDKIVKTSVFKHVRFRVYG